MCSSWYQYRYLSPHFDGGPFDPEEGAYWLPVDQYTGGIEHATMHLMYTRFFTKAMRDCGIFAPTEAVCKAMGRDTTHLWDEPMLALYNQGMILGEPRNGDWIVAEGVYEGDKLNAKRISVIDSPDEAQATANGHIVGEVMARRELILDVLTPDGRSVVVDTDENTVFDVPRFGPDATINQVRYHLDVEKMSKSKGNVVAPDVLVQQYGADTVRAYLMLAFEWQKGGPWDSQGIQGPVRWLNETWELVTEGAPQGKGDPNAERDLMRKVHQTNKRIGDTLRTFRFNSSIAALMSLKNVLVASKKAGGISPAVWNDAISQMLLMMAPFTPFIAEEMWARTGHEYSIHNQPWPAYDPEIAAEEEITLVVQVNGKVRDHIQVPADVSEEDAKRLAMETEGAVRHMKGQPPRKVIYIAKTGMINIVV